MSFDASLHEFTFLSELYSGNSEGAVMLAEYPSSKSPHTIYQNTDKFIIHDPYPPPARSLLKILGPHHLMCCWGNKMPITSEIGLSRLLVDHWRRIFGDLGCPDWQKFNNKERYITLFPHETIPSKQQEICPETLYALHSKEVIGKIDCPQAGILNDIVPPCIIKLSHGYAGLGNFFVYTEDDAKKYQSYINTYWPNANIVINEILSDIVGDYGVQFYLNRNGEITWLGFTHQAFDENYKWSGGTFIYKQQDDFYAEFMKIAKPVSDYLDSAGYYGVVGIDILQNKKDEFFLVDLNPRLTGATPFLIASRLFLKQGYTDGIYVPSASFSGNIEDLISTAEGIRDARVLVLSAYEEPDVKKTICHISISSTSIDNCQKVFDSIMSL